MITPKNGRVQCTRSCLLWVKSRHAQRTSSCRLCANSGHVLRKQKDRRGAVWLRISDFVENRLAVSARRYRGIVILPSGRRFIGYIVLLVLFGLLPKRRYDRANRSRSKRKPGRSSWRALARNSAANLRYRSMSGILQVLKRLFDARTPQISKSFLC